VGRGTKNFLLNVHFQGGFMDEPALVGSLLAAAAMNDRISQEQYAYLLRVARQ